MGKPTDQCAKALVFQNFETPVKPWQVRGGDSVLDGDWGWTLKGAFVLPQEIRESQIQFGEAPRAENRETDKARNWVLESSAFDDTFK